MLRAESLIFDLDGTLWDTLEACVLGWNRVAPELGVASVQAEDLARCMGKTVEEIQEMLFPDESHERGKVLMQKCFEAEQAMILERGGQLYPGVAELLPQLKQSYRLFLVSNCDEPYLDLFRQTTSLAPLFDELECHGATGLSKGENIRALMQRNQIEHAVYIGDTPSDQAGAALAEIPLIYASYGFGTVDDYAARIDSFSELQQVVQPMTLSRDAV